MTKAFQVSTVATLVALAWSHLAAAQMPRLKPIPPTRGAARALAFRASPAASPSVATSGSPWTPLTNQPSFLADGAAAPALLTDGTVLVQDAGYPDWWRLTPDKNGSYVNGTWTQIASLPASYSPLYHSAAVLPDGRFIIEGGEYNALVPAWTAQGSIYDPLANTWTPVAPPPFFDVIEVVPGVYGQTIGDAQSVVLSDGTYMQADCCTTQQALLDAKTLTWIPTGKNKADWNDEEGWTLLKNGKVLTVDAYVNSYDATGTNSEIYDPNTGAWSSAGSTKVQLWDSQVGCAGGPDTATYEVGPAVLRADGTVFSTGADTCPSGAGKTAIYDSHTGKWRAGPTFPVVDGVTDLNIADGPASWEPNDKVLVMASPAYGAPPSVFFEWDGKNLNQVPGPPNAPIDGSYYGNMLLLPTGQILFTDFSNDIEIYTPTVRHEDDDDLRERITPVVFYSPEQVHPGKSYRIEGIRFNGVTLGAAYGDDAQAATNFPLVRITNIKTSHVFYSRTHDHSSMAVASDDVVSTHFDVPADQEHGPSLLQVVVNGVASEPVYVRVH
jgi:hypothetical protein